MYVIANKPISTSIRKVYDSYETRLSYIGKIKNKSIRFYHISPRIRNKKTEEDRLIAFKNLEPEVKIFDTFEDIEMDPLWQEFRNRGKSKKRTKES